MTTHRHDRPPLRPVNPATYGAPAGAAVNMDDAWNLLAAALEGCRACQRAGMYEVTRAHDHLPAAHLIATAYNVVSSVIAPRVGPMSDEHIALKYAPPTQRVFRALRDEGPAAAAGIVAAMNRDERRAAVDDALDLLAGINGAMETLEALEQPASEGPFDAAGVKVVTLDELGLQLDLLPPAPKDLLLAWWARHAAVVADAPPVPGLTAAGAVDLNIETWKERGFDLADPFTAPPRLPAGWAVRLRDRALEAIATPGGAWWQADEAGLATRIPDPWVETARTHRAVAVIVGDIGLDRTDDIEDALARAVRAGRVACGLAALQEGP